MATKDYKDYNEALSVAMDDLVKNWRHYRRSSVLSRINLNWLSCLKMILSCVCITWNY